VAVGNHDDEGVRSGDRCSEAGAVGDIRMLGNRLVDGAEGGGGGGGSMHRGWAAELKDQLPLGDGLRLGEKSLPLPLVATGDEAISGSGRGCCFWASGGCGFRWPSLGRLRCGSRSGAGSESSDLCSQGLDLLLQRGDNFLVLALSR
jgi:hypothetical protein